MTPDPDPAAHPYVMMARNNAWANEVLHDAVTRLHSTDFTAPRPGFFPALSTTLTHILLIDRMYLSALEGKPVTYSQVHRADFTDPARLAHEQRAEDRRLLSFCHGLTAPALQETRDTIRRDGIVPERLDALLLHLFQHQIHHRGQAHVQLQDAGVDPPQLDDFYLIYGRVPSAQAWQDR